MLHMGIHTVYNRKTIYTTHAKHGSKKKTRPCIVISPNEMNVLKTVIIAPMTSKGFDFIFRPKIKFEKKDGLVLLDQIRTVDKTTSKEIAKMLVNMFEL